MTPQRLLGKLYKPVHAARRLKGAGACDCCYDYVDYIGGWGARSHAESQHEYGETDTRYGSESQTAVA